MSEPLYFDFKKALSAGLSKKESIDYLREKKSDINWENIEKSARDFVKNNPNAREEDFIFDTLSKNAPRIYEEKELEKIPAFAYENPIGAMANTIFEASKQVVGLGDVQSLKTPAQREYEEKIKKNIELKQEKNISLSRGEADYEYLREMGGLKNFLSFNKSEQEKSEELQELHDARLSALEKSNFKDLNKAERDALEHDRNIFSYLYDKTLGSDDERLREWQEQTIAREVITPQVESALAHLQNISKSEDIFSLFGEKKENKEKYLRDVQKIADLAGFEGIGYNEKGEIFFSKNGTYYKPNQNFINNFGEILASNAFSIAGGIAGAARGFSAGVTPLDRTIKSIAGAALGSGLGGALDYQISNYYLNREANFEEMLRHSLQEGALSIVGDTATLGVMKLGKKAIKVLPRFNFAQKIENVLEYTPIFGFAKRALNGNTKAAYELINKTYSKEEQDALKEFLNDFGGEIKLGDKEKSFQNLVDKFGSDSFISKGAKNLYEIFTLNNQKEAQKEFLHSIRADESGNLIGFLAEAANVSPAVNSNLKSILNKTTFNLKKQLDSLDIKPSEVREVFNDLESGTKSGYTQAMEDVLGKLYNDDYKVIINRDNGGITPSGASLRSARSEEISQAKATQEIEGAQGVKSEELEPSAAFEKINKENLNEHQILQTLEEIEPKTINSTSLNDEELSKILNKFDNVENLKNHINTRVDKDVRKTLFNLLDDALYNPDIKYIKGDKTKYLKKFKNEDVLEPYFYILVTKDKDKTFVTHFKSNKLKYLQKQITSADEVFRSAAIMADFNSRQAKPFRGFESATHDGNISNQNLKNIKPAQASRPSYNAFRAKLEREGLVKQDALGFLDFVENTIYNPKGVSFEQLNNALKNLNAFYNKDTNPSLKSYIKNAVTGFIREDIKNGLDAIFAQNKALYKKASNLFATALNDYATMKATLKLVDKLKIRDAGTSYAKVLKALQSRLKGQGGELDNLKELTKGLDKTRVEALELNILQDLFNSHLFTSKDLVVFDSREFFKNLGQIQAEFSSKSARDFIDIARGFDKLFKNDALIAQSLSDATTKRLGSSIATSIEGAIRFQAVRMMFDQVVRLLPKIPFLKDLNERVQGAALRYHIKSALSKSLDVLDFASNLEQRAQKGNFTNETRKILEDIALDVEKAQDEMIEGIYKQEAEAIKESPTPRVEEPKEGQAPSPFGINYAEFYHKGKQALEHLLKEKQGQVAGAFYREELGDIDLVWGEVTDKAKHTGYGLAHILDKHGDFDIDKIPEIIKNGSLKKTFNGYNIEAGNYVVGLNKGFNKEGKKVSDNAWIVTSFERKGTSSIAAVTSHYNQPMPEKPFNANISNPTLKENKNLESGAKGETKSEVPKSTSEANKSAQALEQEASPSIPSAPVELYTSSTQTIKELRKELDNHLTPLLHKEITNFQTGEVATLSKRGLKKMQSQEAILKSINNGFTENEHFAAARNIKELFENASKTHLHNDLKHSDSNVTIHRYSTPLIINGKDTNALITAKEYLENGKKLYSIELEGLERARFNLSGKDPADVFSKSKDYDTATLAAPIEKPNLSNPTLKENKNLESKAEAKGQSEIPEKGNIKISKIIDEYAKGQKFKNLPQDKQNIILKLKDIEPEIMPDGINIKGFENLKQHFNSKADKEQREKFLKLFEATKAKPDIVLEMLEKGELRQEFIKAFKHKESKDLYYLVITKDDVDITGIPTTKVRKVINDIARSERVIRAGAFEKIAYPAEPLQNANKFSTLNDNLSNPTLKENKANPTNTKEERAADQADFVKAKGFDYYFPPANHSHAYLASGNTRGAYMGGATLKEEDLKNIERVNLLDKEIDELYEEVPVLKDFKEESQKYKEELKELIYSPRKVLKRWDERDYDFFYNLLSKEQKKFIFNLEQKIINKLREILETHAFFVDKRKKNKAFGTNYAEFWRDGEGGAQKLINEAKDYEKRAKQGKLSEQEKEQGAYKGQVAGAFYREELGDIDLVWGEADKAKHTGYGLAHILDKHGKEFKDLPRELAEAVREGKLIKQSEERYRIEKDNYVVGINAKYNGEHNNYIITAFTKKDGGRGTLSRNHSFTTASDNLTENPSLAKGNSNTDKNLSQTPKQAEFLRELEEQNFSTTEKSKKIKDYLQEELQNTQKQIGYLNLLVKRNLTEKNLTENEKREVLANIDELKKARNFARAKIREIENNIEKFSLSRLKDERKEALITLREIIKEVDNHFRGEGKGLSPNNATYQGGGIPKSEEWATSLQKHLLENAQDYKIPSGRFKDDIEDLFFEDFSEALNFAKKNLSELKGDTSTNKKAIRELETQIDYLEETKYAYNLNELSKQETLDDFVNFIKTRLREDEDAFPHSAVKYGMIEWDKKPQGIFEARLQEWKDLSKEEDLRALAFALDNKYIYKNYDATTEEILDSKLKELNNNVISLAPKALKLNLGEKLKPEDVPSGAPLWANDFNKLKYKSTFNTGADIANPSKLEKIRAQIQDFYSIHPNKAFGTNYAEFWRDGEGGAQKLINEAKDYEKRAKQGKLSEQEKEQGAYKGQVAGAFYREELGDIDLVWGEGGKSKSDGWGLAKIAKYHKEVIDKLSDIIENAPIVKETQGRYKLDDGTYFASIRKDFDNKKTNWVLTAFEHHNELGNSNTDKNLSQTPNLEMREGERETKSEVPKSTSEANKSAQALEQETKPRSKKDKKTKDLLEWHKDSAPITKNKDGSPKVFYHGSASVFDTFKYGSDELGKKGFYFSSSPQVAQTYKVWTDDDIYKVYLKIKNPYIADFKGNDYNSKFGFSMIEKLKNMQLYKKYDGVVFKNIRDEMAEGRGEMADTIVVFNPNQIKSIDNKGSFTDSLGNITGKKRAGAKHKYFNENSDNIYYSHPYVGSSLFGGAVAGISEDEQGNITFDPTSFTLGLLGGGAGALALKQGFKVLKENQALKDKVINELSNALALGFNRAKQTYPALNSLSPSHIMKSERGRRAQARAMLKEIEKGGEGFLANKIAKEENLRSYAKELPKSLSYPEFRKQFNTNEKGYAMVNTPIGRININVLKTYKHFTKNTHNQNRIAFNGALLETFNNPLFIVKEKYPPSSEVDSFVFYKPFIDKGGLLHLAAFAINKNNKLLYTTFYNANKGKLERFIKAKDKNLLYVSKDLD